MKDAECAERNEKSIIRFLVFEIWSFLYSKLVSFSMNFEYKFDHNSKIKNLKISKNFFYNRFRTLRIFHVNLTFKKKIV